MMNPVINILQLQVQMKNGGCWLLNDASVPMKKYAEKNNLDVRQYRTPQKFIQQQEQIVIVSVSLEIWAGVKIYDLEDIMFKERNDTILVLAEKGTSKNIVSAADDYVDDKFVEKMISTGYITREEYEFYSSLENQHTLTLIQTIII